jgi:hypothetical protein
VRALLYESRYSTKGVQKIFRDHGVKYVAELGRLAAAGQTLNVAPIVNEDADDREPAPAANGAGEAAAAAPAAINERLGALLLRLERAQRALDDAVVALETIDFGGRD